MRFLLSILGLAFPLAALAAPPDFDKDIAPLLAARCLDCHGGAKPKGDLDLSRKSGAATVLEPGKPDDSELWNRVKAGEMPPKKPLSEAEQRLLKEWIGSGAKWGSDPIDPFRFTTANRAGYDWWALQPVKPGVLPLVGVAHPIDAFIQAKLGDKRLSLSPPADKRTLLRRLHFDLVGLPPTPEEVDSFLQDNSPNGYEKRVDALLASPHYGERWARHWLDVVRFGETDGFERNGVRPNAWHYRDWVIRALNADVPYDQFAALQLAGDVVLPDDPDAIAATGFLVAGLHNTVLGNEQMRAIARQDELEDLVGSVGQTFLGMTVNCARCHDHKFDPISQTEFYRMQAALAGVGHGERAVPDTRLMMRVSEVETKLRTTQRDLAVLEEPVRRAILAERTKGKAKLAAPPSAVAAWDFRTGPNDRLGKLHAKPIGGAKFTPDGAVLDGKTGFLRTAPLSTDLREKTLEAWVKLDNLKQRGGGVFTVQSPDGAAFDAIVFGEREPGRWIAGSNFFNRTQPFHGDEESEANPIHFAIAYSSDGTITGYRNGKLYGKPYKSNGPVTFKAGQAAIAFGCRHEPAGGNKMLAGTVIAARLYDNALSTEEVAASAASGPASASDAEIEARLSPEQRTQRNALRAASAKHEADLAALLSKAKQKVYAVVPQAPGITRFLHRGDATAPGDIVTPGGLKAVNGVVPDFGLPVDAGDAQRRLKLAQWIASPKNPLFARVIVNRLWHYHFGTGLVETPNDFGFNGGRPTHPELLDWLAAELVSPTKPTDGGPWAFADRPWALKRLHKLIVTSATYRQASAPRKDALAIDADNRLLWRMEPRRLDGESLRDSMLSVSGLLNPEIGGKGFSDYRERNFNGTAFFDPIDPVGPEFHRRSIYRFVPRGGNAGLLDAFDCPDPASAAPRRAVTTTPLQALALWNSGFALRASDAFAARIENEAPGDATKQVRLAWRLAYQSEPSAEEVNLAAQLVRDHGLKALCRALFNSNEFLTVA